MQIIGYILIVIGILFIITGLLGIFRFHNFYARLLSAADIDTVGLVTILIGVMFLSGFSGFTLKVAMILILILLVNPIVSSSLAASAFFSGYKLKEDNDDDDS